MALQDLLRWLIPREDQFYSYLLLQAAESRKGALALGEFRNGKSALEVSAAVQAHEHEGDRIVYEMENALGRTFVTPIDREDLQRLSAELDDILDLTNSAARAATMFGVETPTQPMTHLIGVLIDCTGHIETAITKMTQNDYAAVLATVRIIRQLEKDGDAVFRTALSRLFHDPSVEAKVLLREKEVLEDLEHAVDRCEHLAHTLAHLAVKHG